MSNTRTVGAAGDHTTIGSAAVWMAANHTLGVDGIGKIQEIDGASYNETVDITGVGGTASIISFIKLTTTDSIRYSGGFGAGHATIDSTGGGHALDLGENYTQVEHFQIEQASSTNSDECIRVDANFCLISRCILKTNNITQQDGVYINAGATPTYIDNNLFFDCYRVGIHRQDIAAGATVYFDYNTFIGCGAQNAVGDATGGIGSNNSSDTMIGHNNLAIDCYQTNSLGFISISSSGQYSGTQNISCEQGGLDSSAEDEFGVANNYGSVDVTDSASPSSGEWVYITDLTTPYDARIVEQGVYDVTQNGTDRTGSEPDARQDFSTDITGASRLSFTIGAFEFISISAFHVMDLIGDVIGGDSINGGLLTFYQANGATSGDMMTAEREFLIARGVASGHLNDMWFEFIEGVIGLSSSLSDMKHAWLKVGAPLV